MIDQPLNLILLPGMDGTGELFAEIVRELPGWLWPRVVRYPRDKKLSLGELQSIALDAIPAGKPFVLLGDSFSSLVAVRISAERPEDLRAVVICAGFVSSPVTGLRRRLACLMAPLSFHVKAPGIAVKRYLLGRSSSASLVKRVQAATVSVAGRVMRHRLRMILACNEDAALEKVVVPVLYVQAAGDRLVAASAFERIQKIQPGAVLVRIDGPHLILQTKPREAVGAITAFLQSQSTSG